MEQKLITDIHKDVVRLNTQAFHPKKYIRRRVIRKHLNRLKDLVIDIGCGRGEDLPYMTNASRVIGYDLDAEILKYYSAQNNINAVAGDATSMPFKEGSIDSVNCIDVLEHIPDYRSAIRDIYRMLKIGGVLVISVPTDPSLFSKRDEEIGHIRLFETDLLIDDLKKTGFKIDLVKKYGTIIYPYVKYVANKMSIKELHDMQRKKSFILFKIAFNIFIKMFLNLDYYIPQGKKNVGVLIVAVK